MDKGADMKQIYLGGVSACIAGDHRYSTSIDVRLEGDVVTIQERMNGASGGMDGDGTALTYRVNREVTCKPTPGDIVKAIKRMIDTESPNVIKQYGKPSKRFYWAGTTARGLSVKLCTEVLKGAKEYLTSK